MGDKAYSRLLAEFVSDFDVSAIPDEVLVRTRQSVLNGIAAALSASREEAIGRLIRVCDLCGAHGDARVFGRTERLPMLEAALVNGYMAHFNDYDDTHWGTVFHTNSPVVPPLLLLAADRHLSGTEVLHSLALGLEASIRLGIGLGREHYSIGWHITGTMGTVGASLACSRLLKLDARRTNYALGFSLTQASGLRGQMFGTAAKALNAGTGAMNGLLSALLAEQGLDAAEDAIEGTGGYASAAAPEPVLESITDGLGVSWHTPNIGFKPYAAGVAMHASIDAVMDLRRQLGLSRTSAVADVDRALDRMQAVDLIMATRGFATLPRGREITAGLQAKFSMYNTASVAFVKGHVGPNDFSDDIVTDPQIKAFRDMLTLVGNDDLPHAVVRFRAQLKDGSTLTGEIDQPIGSPDKPMSDADIRGKLLDAGEGRVDEPSLQRLADLTERLEEVQDTATLVELAVPMAAR